MWIKRATIIVIPIKCKYFASIALQTYLKKQDYLDFIEGKRIKKLHKFFAKKNVSLD